MKTLEETISSVPDGYGWLLRNDKTKGFLANVTTPNFENHDGAIDNRECFPVYASTPHEALEKSIARAKAAMR